MAEDLYAILELSRNATEADLKKAYRRLARQHHPDVNKDPGAEARFKEVQKAYTVLSDTKRRAQYDQFGVTDDTPGGTGGGQGFDGFGSGFEDIFDAFFGGGGRSSSRRGPRRGEDLRYDLEMTLEEVASGANKEIQVFHLESCGTCNGNGRKPGTSKSTCSHCQGSGQVKTVQRTLLGAFSQVVPCSHCHGTGEMVTNPCSTCRGTGSEKKRKTLHVDIPAGVDRGTKLRVSGEGNYGEPGSEAGDLYVFITVKEHQYFSRDGDDVHLEIQVPFAKAILGTEVEVLTLQGKALLKIPEGTQSGTVFKLRGKGIPHLRGGGYGDQLVRIKVKTPNQLSSKERKLIEEFAELRGEAAKDKSLFDYVKRLF